MDPRPDQALPSKAKGRRRLVWAERLLLAAGGLLLAAFALARISGWMASSAALQQFDRERPEAGGRTAAAGMAPLVNDEVDFSLWSKQRIQAFKESLTLTQDRALAVLELDRLGIRVPVFEGTGDLVLNRGAGWIAGTARPGEAGNIGIAGHRDGFFRGLKDVRAGDLIELQMPDRTEVYRVMRTEVIQPEEIRVLLPTTEPTLTLVTCYPFYHVGSAPQRFIVQATPQ